MELWISTICYMVTCWLVETTNHGSGHILIATSQLFGTRHCDWEHTDSFKLWVGTERHTHTEKAQTNYGHVNLRLDLINVVVQPDWLP